MKCVAFPRPSLALAVGLLAGGPSAALAGAEPSPALGEPQSVMLQPRLRVQILAGGGPGQFTASGPRQMADTAATWQLRSIFSPRAPLGAELAYIGNLQQVRFADQSRTADLYGNGAEAALRFQAPLLSGRLHLAPFVAAGVGWTRYHLGAGPSGDPAKPVRPVVEPLPPPETGLQQGRRL